LSAAIVSFVAMPHVPPEIFEIAISRVVRECEQRDRSRCLNPTSAKELSLDEASRQIGARHHA
jgi:hypothetical protein